MDNLVSSRIRAHLRRLAPYVRERETARLLESAVGEIERLDAALQSQTMTHLLYLLEGLEVPNPQWWLEQPPEALRRLGQSVAKQAKCNALNEMATNDKERKTSPQ